MSHCCLSRPWIKRSALFIVSLLLIGASAPADEIDDEFRFASALIEWGFADYADKVVQQILRQFPSQQDRAKLIQAEILISRRKFTEAEDLVKAMGAGNPKAQAISLALAKGYYAMGETDKSKTLYNDFFKLYEGKVPTDPDLLRFYQDSAYQFGQMLEAAGDKEGAIKAYARVLTTNPDRTTMRMLQAQQAELYVAVASSGPEDQKEKNLVEAKKLCDQIQWGGLDIPFGQSIITAAHIEMVRGNNAAAQKVLQNNLDILKEIDTYLKDSGLDRDTVIEKLQAQHIQTRPVWALIHEQADYPRNEAYALDKAEDYRKYIVNLPCSTNLSMEDCERVCQAVLAL